MTTIDSSNFIRLIGIWKTSGQIITDTETIELKGIDTYNLILDGYLFCIKQP